MTDMKSWRDERAQYIGITARCCLGWSRELGVGDGLLSQFGLPTEIGILRYNLTTPLYFKGAIIENR